MRHDAGVDTGGDLAPTTGSLGAIGPRSVSPAFAGADAALLAPLSLGGMMREGAGRGIGGLDWFVVLWAPSKCAIV